MARRLACRPTSDRSWNGPRRPVRIHRLREAWRSISPAQLLVGSFLLLIALGTPGFRLLPDLYTGATIFGGANTPAIETMPNAFLFWRSLAHQLGGMGIIVLTLAIPPILGVGGMAGSTGGGVKVVHHLLFVKNSLKEVKQLVHPQAILPVRLNGSVVPNDVMANVLSFIVLYLALLFAGTLGIAALGLDLFSAFGAALSSIGNVGPAFGTFGPTENYAHLPALGKWVLALLMVAAA